MRLQFNLILFFVAVASAYAGHNPLTIKAERASAPPVIDGYGNDEVWKRANTAGHFVQRFPFEGRPATEQTEIKVLFDNDNLYFFCMMYDSAPDSIVALLARRDNEPESDYISIRIDSYHDYQTSFEFTINASGTKTDILEYDDGKNEDPSWDPVWDVQTRRLPNGWSAEVKIPLQQLRFTEGNDVWGINFIRTISRKQETDYWALIPQNQTAFTSLFGTMTGMAEIKKPALFEVLPYTVGSSSYYPRTIFRDRVAKFRPDIGADIKYGITSNFTVDLTVNPDFAQVEADPEILNLTTFETFYPEKRPFFIEGTQILRFTTFGGDFGPGLFYSRRIGKAIAAEPPYGGVLTDEPQSATILGAAKLTGKTQQGTSIGVLTALTDEEQFTFRDVSGSLHTQRAEPRASYNLLRIKQDFGGNSNVGAILTNVSRNTRLPVYAGGTDWNVYFDNSTYRLDGFFAHSRTQTLMDELREGNAGKAHVGKVSGNWLYDLSYDFTSKKYNINDMGFFFSPNDYGVNAGVTYRELEPGDLFRSYQINPSLQLRWNYDHLTVIREPRLAMQVQLLNYWLINATAVFDDAVKDPYEPRFNGVYNAPQRWILHGEVQSDVRKTIIVDVAETFTHGDDGQRSANSGMTMIIRPTTSMEYQLALNYNRERHRTSFASVISDSVLTFAPSLPVALFGVRDVDNVDVTLRSSILFTRELSLQVYNQLFWAKGQYNNFGVLPPSGDLVAYKYTGNLDFNRTSLISNVVLRWEYREGSTLYVVWSHGRSFFQNGGFGTDIATNIDNTFLAAPDNVYVVKISYWWNL